MSPRRGHRYVRHVTKTICRYARARLVGRHAEKSACTAAAAPKATTGVLTFCAVVPRPLRNVTKGGPEKCSIRAPIVGSAFVKFGASYGCDFRDAGWRVHS